MLSFPITSVREVIARGRADAEANGGFRNPYYGLRPGKNEQPGLWLVGDHGVYVMSNGKLPDGAKPLVVYAEECDPSTNDDWFDVKRRTFGGDDGVDFLDAEQLGAIMAVAPEATHLRIAFLQDSMQLTLISKSQPLQGRASLRGHPSPKTRSALPPRQCFSRGDDARHFPRRIS